MPRSRIRATVALATALVTATLVGGAAIVLERARQTARTGAELSLQRTAQVVENALNRQLLQVDSALAGLPGLFAVAGEPGAPLPPERATRILQGLNVQSLAFRDLVLVRPDGTPWASARPRSRMRPLPISREYLLEGRSLGATMVAGPARNPLNGEWALYLARPVAIPGAGEVVAVAEVPLATLTSSIAEAAGDAPNLRVALETADGRLLASLPHDERAIGRPRDVAVSRLRVDGEAFDLPADGAGGPAIAAARQTLYGDIRVAVTLDAATALADWSRDRDRLIAVVALAELLVLASAAALFWALRRQERLEAERQLARNQLENAIEAMSDGFVMWDREDRLVTCNGKYRELYDKSAAFIRPGATFEEIMRGATRRGSTPRPAPTSTPGSPRWSPGTTAPRAPWSACCRTAAGCSSRSGARRAARSWASAPTSRP
jgi:PAS domain-containing protein